MGVIIEKNICKMGQPLSISSPQKEKRTEIGFHPFLTQIPALAILED